MGPRVLSVTIGAFLLIGGLAAVPGRGDSSPTSSPTQSQALQPRGAGSCSATACHGGVRPASGRILRNEHTVWITRDPHAEAYQTLLGERSKSIARNLGEGPPAHQNPKCLACHSTAVPAESPLREAITRDGVSCEACHGASQNWLTEHTLDSWSSKSQARKQELGMLDTKNLTTRAKLCSGCHVGEPGRDVDHDLIAAGHPRLTFELRAYHAQMPRHWRAENGPEAVADAPARLWKIGRVVNEIAALDLLAHRAETAAAQKSKRQGPRWPELSEYGCFACHHELKDRLAPDRVGIQRGMLPWRTWEFANAGTLIHDPATVRELEALTKLMGQPRPKPDEVARSARGLSTKLSAGLESANASVWSSESLRAALGEIRSLPAAPDWDGATQRYLEREALHQALRSVDPSKPDESEAAELTRLRNYLNYPKGFDSPKGFSTHPSR